MSTSKEPLTKTTIVLKNEEVLTFKDTEDERYLTQVGVAGELILYRMTTAHRLLANLTMDKVIWKVWADGHWESLEFDAI